MAGAIRRALKPFLDIRIGDARIYGRRGKVRFPKNFNGHFAKGDTVIKVHVETKPATPTGRRDIATALRELRKKSIALKNEDGIAGIYGDSQNPTVVNHFKRVYRRNVDVFKPPFWAGKLAKAKYRLNVTRKKYPKEHAKKPPKRVVVKF